MSNEVTLTSENFEQEVLKSPIPVLVDFWAEWCGPCRMIAPAVDELARAYEGKIKVGKVDVDSQVDLAGRFGIISIPTLMVFKDGKAARQKVGALPKLQIEGLFKDLIQP
ncbi:MAG: thioredoxin [Treponema sp.]|nr:thioredoxin [Treponema sp.]